MKLIVVTGAAASGKSAHAETILCNQTAFDQRLYLACMQPFGADAKFRIDRHRLLRQGKGFVTCERYLNLKDWRPKRNYDGILLECLSNLLANELFSPEGAGQHAVAEILQGIDHLAHYTQTLVVVTNEIFDDGICYDAQTTQYIQMLGALNCALAQRADIVVESVCGILCTRKGSLS